MTSQNFISNSVPKTNPYLSPAYLLSLSSQIQTLSSFYLQQNLPSLTQEYKSFLGLTFKNLANSLTVFEQDQTMLISSLVGTRVELQSFVGEKLFYLLQRETRPLAEIVRFIVQGYRENAEHYEEILMREKKKKVEMQQGKNEAVVNNLRREVVIKREYVKQLQERVRELEDENSNIYQKIIDNAKHTISSTLIQSKLLTSSSQLLTPSKQSKSTLPQQASPKVSHKQLSLKQVEESVLQILHYKRKQQSISMKRSSMKSYVKYFFKYKFGLSQLCQEMRSNFLGAVRHFLSGRGQQEYVSENTMRIQNTGQQQQQQQLPLLLVFQKLLQEQVDEVFFWNEYIPRGLGVIKVFKRYLNQKQKIQLKQLSRLYEGYQGISGAISNYSSNKIIFNQQERKDFQLQGVDVRQILSNVYTRNKDIQTLQMIFLQIIGQTQDTNDNWIGFGESSIIMSRMKQHESTATVLSKQLLAIILCYEIESYSMKIAPLTHTIKKHSFNSEFVSINYTGLEKVILEMKVQQQRYLPYLQKNFTQIKDKDLSYSQTVEIIEALTNPEKGDNNKNITQAYSSKKL